VVAADALPFTVEVVVVEVVAREPAVVDEALDNAVGRFAVSVQPATTPTGTAAHSARQRPATDFTLGSSHSRPLDLVPLS